MVEKGHHCYNSRFLDVAQILASPLDAAINLGASDSKDALGLDVVVNESEDQPGYRDLQNHRCHAFVETYIAIRVFECMDLTSLTNDQETKAVCIFFVCVKNFHCQTCLQPLGLMSSSYPYRDYLK